MAIDAAIVARYAVVSAVGSGFFFSIGRLPYRAAKARLAILTCPYRQGRHSG